MLLRPLSGEYLKTVCIRSFQMFNPSKILPEPENLGLRVLWLKILLWQQSMCIISLCSKVNFIRQIHRKYDDEEHFLIYLRFFVVILPYYFWITFLYNLNQWQYFVLYIAWYFLCLLFHLYLSYFAKLIRNLESHFIHLIFKDTSRVIFRMRPLSYHHFSYTMLTKLFPSMACIINIEYKLQSELKIILWSCPLRHVL